MMAVLKSKIQQTKIHFQNRFAFCLHIHYIQNASASDIRMKIKLKIALVVQQLLLCSSIILYVWIFEN